MLLAPRSICWLLVLAVLFVASTGQAKGNEPAAKSLIARAMRGPLKTTPLRRAAKARLDLAKRVCGRACSQPTRADLAVAYGVLAALQGEEKRAKEQFDTARSLVPDVALPESITQKNVRTLFSSAAAAGAKETQAAEKDAAEKDDRRSSIECDKGTSVQEAPEGWSSARSFCYYAEALSAEAAQRWAHCADFVSRSLDEDQRIESRQLFAQCVESSGKLRDALKAYRVLIKHAAEKNLRTIELEARTRTKLLKTRIPKLTIRVPSGASKLEVTINGESIALDQLGGELWLDPGPQRVVAKGKLGRERINYREQILLGERQRKTIMVTADAPTRKVSQPSDVTVKVEGELSGYMDTDAVEVATPSVHVSVEHPTNGWGVGAFFLVDVVTAASADIVATASPRWTEVRYVPGLSAHNMFGEVDVAVSGTVSIEPDYLAIGSGIGLTTNFRQKTITPTLRYDFGYDISGRSGTPFSVFSEKIHRHGITAGASVIIDKHSIIAPSFTAVLEFGDTSKPYRYLPTFSPGVEVLKGETIESVNEKRTSVRIADQVPVKRQRYALAALYARRFTKVTFRVSERLYVDSWGVKSTTTDMLLPWDITRHIRVWPHIRFYAQTGADFWKRAYVVERSGAGLSVPLLRTGDRELGPMLAGTAGAAARFEFGSNTAGRSFGLTLKADAVYARFLDHLFTRGRLGVFGGATGEVIFR